MVMGLMDRFSRRRSRRAAQRSERRRTPSFREMRARMRTEQAESRLLETEAMIHQEAARMRLGRRRRG
jgi:hypothetical protein